MKNLQIAILIIFGIFTAIGVLVFAGIIPSPKKAQESITTGNVVIWGTIGKPAIEDVIRQSINPVYQGLRVSYQQFAPEAFAGSLIEALAAGSGPDAIIVPDNLFLRFKSKIQPFDVTLVSERQLLDNYIDNAQIFVFDQGVYALPLWTDPMVMYWNRDMFSTAGIAKAPVYWDEFLTITPILTKKTQTNDITKSSVALGAFENVLFAKDILALLMFQIGNSIVQRTPEGYTSLLGGYPSLGIPSLETSLSFFTDFSDPLSANYSWNRSLPDSRTAFANGDLAVYFGYASELAAIRKKNPNLNFDIAQMPQVRNSTRKTTFGKIGGIAVLKASPSKMQSFFVAQIFGGTEVGKLIADSIGTPSPHRGALSGIVKDPNVQIFNASALISKTWSDPNSAQTDKIFQTAIDSVLSGQAVIGDATSRANTELAALLKGLI